MGHNAPESSTGTLGIMYFSANSAGLSEAAERRSIVQRVDPILSCPGLAAAEPVLAEFEGLASSPLLPSSTPVPELESPLSSVLMFHHLATHASGAGHSRHAAGHTKHTALKAAALRSSLPKRSAAVAATEHVSYWPLLSLITAASSSWHQTRCDGD